MHRIVNVLNTKLPNTPETKKQVAQHVINKLTKTTIHLQNGTNDAQQKTSCRGEQNFTQDKEKNSDIVKTLIKVAKLKNKREKQFTVEQALKNTTPSQMAATLNIDSRIIYNLF